MLEAIVSLLGRGIAKQIRDAYISKHNAETEAQRIEADVTIARLEAIQASRANGARVTAAVQALWATPFIIYNFKVVVWDKVMGLGATDALSDQLAATQTTVVGFYFGGAAAIGVVRAIRS